jgi:hypothetical protein
MAQSEAQKRRTTGNVRVESDPSPMDPMDILSALDSAEWVGPPPSGSGGRSGGSQPRPPIDWPEDLLNVAQTARVILPAHPPRRISGAPERWIAAYAPSGDLSCLSDPIPTGTGKTGSKGIDQLLYDAVHGVFRSATGEIKLPSMAKGEALPLVVLIKIIGTLKGERPAYFNRLVAGDPRKKESASLLSAIAKKMGRYAYIEQLTDGSYVVGLHSEPFGDSHA